MVKCTPDMLKFNIIFITGVLRYKMYKRNNLQKQKHSDKKKINGNDNPIIKRHTLEGDIETYYSQNISNESGNVTMIIQINVMKNMGMDMIIMENIITNIQMNFMMTIIVHIQD